MELNQNLQQALEAHRRMLHKHLKIWKKAQVQHAQDEPILAAAISCQERTEQMLQQCSSIDFLKLANGNDTTVSKKHKRSESAEDNPKSKKLKRASEKDISPPAQSPVVPDGQRIPVTKDPSGLFLIDSNPDDVDVLMKLSKERQKDQKKKKRSHDSETADKYINVPSEVEESDHEQSTPKRKKAKHREPVKEPADEAEEYSQHLEQKVALRLKEKETVSKQKANKKRKRESDVSLAESQADTQSSIKEPPFKQQEAKVPLAEQPDPAKLGKNAKRRKRGKPEAGHENDTSQPKSRERKVKNSS